jgi:hypothetical protein
MLSSLNQTAEVGKDFAALFPGEWARGNATPAACPVVLDQPHQPDETKPRGVKYDAAYRDGFPGNQASLPEKCRFSFAAVVDSSSPLPIGTRERVSAARSALR